MWSTIAGFGVSVLLWLIKWIFERREGNKMDNIEFMEHIRVHQEKRSGTAKQANDFDEAMKELDDKENDQL